MMTANTTGKQSTLKSTFMKLGVPVSGMLTMTLPLVVVPMGPLAAGLTGAFLMGAAGAVYGWNINDRSREGMIPGDEKYWARTKNRDMKAFGIFSAALGVALGAVIGTESDKREYLKSLPEIDAATPTRTVTLTLADEHCRGKALGETIEITHQGKQYRLECPKIE